MKYFLISTLLFSLTSCSTTNSWRAISSTGTEKPIFKDVTASANVATTATSSIVFGDFNNDNLVDFIAHNRLYKNVSTQGQIRFEDVTQKANLQAITGFPMFVDFNNDGQLDIITAKGQVFLQSSGRFKEVSKIFNFTITPDAYTISYGDLNKDGWPDIIVGRAEKFEDNQFKFVPPQVFLNNFGLGFREISKFQEMQKFPAYTRGIVWADYNNDQKADIYFSNYRLRENFLFNTNQGKMQNIALSTGTKGNYNPKQFYDDHMKANFGPLFGHTIGSVWADFNNDGNFDLWVANLVHKFIGTTPAGKYDYRGYVCDDSKIYKNSGAPHYNFTDMRAQSGIPYKPMGDYSKYKGDELWAHATAADFDNDGLIDMYVTQIYNLKYAYSLLFKNKGNFKFADVSNLGPKLLDTYAGAWADLNNDGKMDLITSGREALNETPRLKIFQNVYQSNNNYVKIKLVGTKSGKNPVTTQVRLYHDRGVLLRQYEGVTGTHNQQNDPILHFGLGTISKINKVEILWNSGKKQTITNNFQLNTTHTIVER